MTGFFFFFFFLQRMKTVKGHVNKTQFLGGELREGPSPVAELIVTTERLLY